MIQVQEKTSEGKKEDVIFQSCRGVSKKALSFLPFFSGQIPQSLFPLSLLLLMQYYEQNSSMVIILTPSAWNKQHASSSHSSSIQSWNIVFKSGWWRVEWLKLKVRTYHCSSKRNETFCDKSPNFKNKADKNGNCTWVLSSWVQIMTGAALAAVVGK